MIAWLAQLFNRDRRGVLVTPQPARLLLTSVVIEGLRAALLPSQQRQHEGVAYLLGRTDGSVTLAVAVFLPDARTTFGSFQVSPRAMIGCMQAAARCELQVVAQVHTHPGEAYHSDGDVDGAKIRYPGYVSLVLPEYGVHLPSLTGAAAYLWDASRGWIELAHDDVIVIPPGAPWTKDTFMIS